MYLMLNEEASLEQTFNKSESWISLKESTILPSLDVWEPRPYKMVLKGPTQL
jgi:hypothetical protein